MPESVRVTLRASAQIPAPAGLVWELIADWAGMLRWWLTAADGGLPGPPLTGCELIGEPGAVPRTRLMTLGSGATTSETIIYQNDQTRRLSYTKADDAVVTGYVASTYVDDLGHGACTVGVESMFDVADPAHRAASVARFEAVYAAMFAGYRRYFSRAG